MPVPFSAKISEKESVLVQTLDDGEAVLLNLVTENYFSLNDGGVAMWNLLIESDSVEEAYTALVARHPEEDPAMLQTDLVEFVETLAEHELVDVQPAVSSE